MPAEASGRQAVPARLTLVVGSQEFLVSREIAQVVAQARAADPGTEVHDVDGGDADLGLLLDLTSPSMFGEQRVLVVRGAQDLSDEVRDGLADYAKAPADDVVLVVAHSGVTKGKRLVDALTAAGADVRKLTAISKPADLLTFVQQEVRRARREVTGGGAKLLVDAVGTDLRELAAAVAQLIADSAENAVLDESLVGRYHRGRASTGGYQVADAAMAGDTAGALRLLRSAMDTGTHELVILVALAAGVRETALVLGAGGGSSGAIAKQLGLPPWKVERIQRTGRGWSETALSQALQAVAKAELDAKGGGASSGYAAERAVLAVADARGAGRQRAGAGARGARR